MLPVDHLSYSSINAYLSCHRLWWWRYIEKPRVPVAVALPFGTAIHKAVQGYIVAKAQDHEVWDTAMLGFQKEKDLVPVSASHLLPESWLACLRNALDEPRNLDNIKWDRPFDYYADLGARMLNAPDVVAAVEDIEPLVIDETAVMEKRIEFFVPGVDVPIIGYIDLIEVDGVPVDFKTASRKWAKGKEHSEMQVDFYLLGLNYEGYDLNPNLQFRYYIFTKTKNPTCQILDTVRGWGALLFTVQTIREAWEGIQAGAFGPNPTGWKCSQRFCEYWGLCRGRGL